MIKHIPSFFISKQMTLKNQLQYHCNYLHSSCSHIASRREHSTPQKSQPQESQLLCHCVVSMSNNTASMTFFWIQKSQQATTRLRWTLQTFCTQKHRFFCSAQILFLQPNDVWKQNTPCCMMFGCHQTTVPKIKIAYICPIVGM